MKVLNQGTEAKSRARDSLVEEQNDTDSHVTCAEHPQCGLRLARGGTWSQESLETDQRAREEGDTGAGARTWRAPPQVEEEEWRGLYRPLATCGQARG